MTTATTTTTIINTSYQHHPQFSQPLATQLSQRLKMSKQDRQGLETRHVSSHWYILFCFLYSIFSITLMINLGQPIGKIMAWDK